MIQIIGTLRRCISCSGLSQHSHMYQYCQRNLLRSVNKTAHFKRHLKIGKETPKKSFTAQHKWDKVPKDYHLIFVNELTNYIGSFRIGISVVTSMAAGLILMSSDRLRNANSDDLMLFFGAPFILLAIVIVGTNIACRQYYKRIYFHPTSGQFIAVRRTWTGRLHHLKYTSEDIVLKPSPEAKFDEAAEVTINGCKVSISARDFVSPFFYNMHLGANFNDHDMEIKSQLRGPRF